MEMYYRTWGDPHKPKLLLLHALACHSGWWDWVSPCLEKEYFLIAPDFRGHGKSPWAYSYSFDDYAKDVEELALKLDGSYSIVGHSMGAYVGLKVASRGVRPPSALLVAEMKIDSPQEELAGLHKASQKNGRIYDTQQDAIANYRLMPPNHTSSKDRVDQVAKECFHEQEDGRWVECFDRRALAIENVEALALAKQVNCPTRIVRAKKSQVMPFEGAQELARITGGELYEMEGAYHHLPLEVPEALASSIRNFINQ